MYSTNRSKEFRDKLIEFAIKIIELSKKVPRTQENSIIFNQIIRSATSIGANYTEAIFALTKADFIHCINISKKETGETLYWLELLKKLEPSLNTKINILIEEAESYLKIFIASVKTSQNNK